MIEIEIETVTVTLEDLKANLEHYYWLKKTKRLEITYEGERIAVVGRWLPDESRCMIMHWPDLLNEMYPDPVESGEPESLSRALEETRGSGFLYLDASAFAKLVRDEKRSEALWRYVGDARLTSSRLLLTEVPRALRRDRGRSAPEGDLAVQLRNAERLLGSAVLRPIDPDMLREAGAMTDPFLRSLDAIHVMTAAGLRP